MIDKLSLSHPGNKSYLYSTIIGMTLCLAMCVGLANAVECPPDCRKTYLKEDLISGLEKTDIDLALEYLREVKKGKASASLCEVIDEILFHGKAESYGIYRSLVNSHSFQLGVMGIVLFGEMNGECHAENIADYREKLIQIIKEGGRINQTVALRDLAMHFSDEESVDFIFRYASSQEFHLFQAGVQALAYSCSGEVPGLYEKLLKQYGVDKERKRVIDRSLAHREGLKGISWCSEE